MHIMGLRRVLKGLPLPGPDVMPITSHEAQILAISPKIC